MSTFNQGVPGVATLINSSAVILSGNAASANALTVRQFGGGNVFSAQTTTGSTALFVGANGNVGVGTNNPGVNTLQVTGNIYMGDGYRQFSLSGGNSFGYLYGCFAKYGDAIHLGYNFYNNNSTNVIPNAAGTTSRMSLGYGSIAMYTGGINAEPTNLGYYQDSTGRIGIGTTNPGTALQVNGDQISVPSYITSPGTPYTTSQQFYFAFNGNLTDSQSGVTATATGPFGGYTNSAVRCNKSWYFTFPNSRVTSTVSQTVAFWFCPLEQSNQTVFSWANGAQTASMNMDLSPSQNRFNIYIATPTSWIVSALGQNAPPYKLGTWIHVALAVSTTSATLYFNGVQVDQQTGSYTSASSTLMTTAYVGANGDASQVRKFNGFLDELRIYNTTLSPTQILTLYNSTTFIANGMSGGSVLTNSIGVGVQTPLNSIDSSGSVALGSYAGANQAPNGGLICSGSVGIGITNPSYPLHVNGSVLSSSQNLKYIDYNGVPNWGTVTPGQTFLSIYGSGKIGTGDAFVIFSDSRIKIEEQPPASYLEIMRNVDVKNFSYIDKIQYGPQKKIGFFAQEVEKVLPDAVSKINDFTPNIFRKCSAEGNCVTVVNHGLLEGVKIRIISSGERVESIVHVVDENTIQVDKNLDPEVFVFGTEVDDFRVLNNDYMSAVAFGGLKELHALVKTQQTTIDILTERLALIESN